MKIALFLIPCFLFACSSKKQNPNESPSIPADAKPVSFTSEEGRFSISFKAAPGEPQIDTFVVPEGKVVMHASVLEANNMAYMADWGDYPSKAVEGADYRKILEAFKERMIKKFDGKITSEKWSGTNGNMAVDFRANGKNLYTVYKLQLVGNRFYLVCILRDQSAVPESEINGFIGTFKINN